ncbi:MAG: hypothetical protein KC496_00095 [Anaerolineae bacterium]|nr:hypothetical protein [Anaerolineae bacterium]
MPSYQYSHHARRALTHAELLAREFRHPRQDTAHLLVAVMLAEGSLGAQAMQGFDLPMPVARVYLKRLMPILEEPPDPVPEDQSFTKALEQAADEAGWLDSHYIGTEHLLLGITRTNLGNAIRLLHLVEITPEQVRRRLRSLISDGQAEFSLEALRANARLSELSRRVLNAAEQQALALDHPEIGVGHLLLALAQERRGITSAFLKQSGLEVEKLQFEIKSPSPELFISIESIVQRAIDQAEKFGSHYVGADHLLLALSLEEQGVILLQRYQTSPEKIRRLLEKHLK